MDHQKIYYIPVRYRKIENLHILLWLIKDACWALNFKFSAMIMIIPTLTIAIIIAYQTRYLISELIHNIAVILWITANCTWMIGEFFSWDEGLVGAYGLRQFSLIPFCMGLSLLGYYYIFLASKKSFREKMFQRTKEIVEKEIQQNQ